MELLNHPAVQGGVAPLVVALLIAILLARTRFAWLAIVAGYATTIALTMGFQFSPLTASRKILLLGLIGLGVGVSTNALFEDGVETLVYFYAGVILSLERRAGAAGESASRAPEARARRARQEARLGE